MPPRKSRRGVRLVTEGINEVVVPRRERSVCGNVDVEQASVHPVENANPEPPIANAIPHGIPIGVPVQLNQPQTALSLITFSSVNELKNAALQVEMEQPEFRARQRGRQEISRSSGQNNLCSKGGSVKVRPNHMVLNCPQKEVICFRCQQPRHIATCYPQSQGASSSSSTFRPVQSVRNAFQGGRG
ncbi:hypothetical protein LIER_04542 [Lithospermum erythrorhizon]|uniref:Uncharacterized protein n=1 Tax=Lithospermum erythrorhizon TaxID=34254 RepID=A0AAV3P1T5_LITER